MNFRNNNFFEEKEYMDVEQIVKDLLKDTNFYKKNNNSCNAFAALLDILDNSRRKLQKLKRENKDLVENKTVLQLSVERIIKALKNRTITETTKNSAEYSIYLSKEDRKRFIDMIMADGEILKIFNDETLPTISIIDRKIPLNK